MGIVLKISMIVLLLITGFSFGALTLFGYYCGAKNREKFFSLFRFCITFISALSLALSILLFLAAPVLLGFFMDSPALIQDGTAMLRWQVVSMVFVGWIMMISIVFQSCGKAGSAFLLSISRQGVVFLAVLLIASHCFGYDGVLAAQTGADLISALFAVTLFYGQRKTLFHESSL